MNGIVYSRAYAKPMRGWVPEVGPVDVVGERELYGHVFQKEIVVVATGMRCTVDAKLVFEGENVAHFIPRRRNEGQMDLGLGEAPCA